MKETLWDNGFWRGEWERQRKESLLASTQERTPENWQDFYEKVGDIWLAMAGSKWQFGEKVSEALFANGALREGDRVIDVGCGPGALSIPLASKGVSLLSVDNSGTMLGELQREAERKNIRGIETLQSDWERVAEDVAGDLVIAAFFPDAFSPKGIEKLETHSNRVCSLVLNSGGDPFPFRGELWKAIMDTPIGKRDSLFLCALNFLVTSGRNLHMVRCSWDTALDISVDDMVRFYSAYFEIFNRKSPAVKHTITQYCKDWGVNGQITRKGRGNCVVLWWNCT